MSELNEVGQLLAEFQAEVQEAVTNVRHIPPHADPRQEEAVRILAHLDDFGIEAVAGVVEIYRAFEGRIYSQSRQLLDKAIIDFFCIRLNDLEIIAADSMLKKIGSHDDSPIYEEELLKRIQREAEKRRRLRGEYQPGANVSADDG